MSGKIPLTRINLVLKMIETCSVKTLMQSALFKTVKYKLLYSLQSTKPIDIGFISVHVI